MGCPFLHQPPVLGQHICTAHRLICITAPGHPHSDQCCGAPSASRTYRDKDSFLRGTAGTGNRTPTAYGRAECGRPLHTEDKNATTHAIRLAVRYHILAKHLPCETHVRVLPVHPSPDLVVRAYSRAVLPRKLPPPRPSIHPACTQNPPAPPLKPVPARQI